MNPFVVVGGGVLGLATAERLTSAGYPVTVVEGGAELGGLTATHELRTAGGHMTCDRFYHVVLEADTRVRNLLDRLGLGDQVSWTSAQATIVKQGRSYPATSPVEMARLPALTAMDRFRVAASVLLSLGLPSVISTRTTSQRWLTLTAGQSAAENFWNPLLRAKLGSAAPDVSASFIVSTFRRLVQARLKGGGDRFGAHAEGYRPVFERWRQELEGRGVTFLTGRAVDAVHGTHPDLQVVLEDGEMVPAGGVVLTTSGPVIQKVLPAATDLQKSARPYLGVLCAAVMLKEAPNDSYITYLVDDVDLTGVIGMHALLQSPRDEGALVYLPRYCAPDDPMFDESDEVVLDRLLSSARRAIPGVNWDFHDARVSRARHVLPLPVPRMADPPPHVTDIPGVYVVSAAQNVSGTLNVEGSLELAESGMSHVIAAHRALSSSRTVQE